MMSTLLSIVICAILFALFGLVRYRGCAGHCEGCTSSCDRLKRVDHHD
jgi:hypothetical protein